MKNYVQDGKALTLAAPYARASGEGAKIGSIFGIAIAAISSGATGVFQTEGVVTLAKDTTAITAGLKVYWDDTNKVVTATSTSNLPIGLAIAAAGTGVASVDVKLGAPPNAGA